MSEKYLKNQKNNWYRHNTPLKYYTRLNPGKIKFSEVPGVPITVLLKKQLNVTSSIVRDMLHRKQILVNNKIVMDKNYPVAPLELITICKKTVKTYRVLINKKYCLAPTHNLKLYFKVLKIKPYKDNKFQLNLTMGYNLVVDTIDYETRGKILVKQLDTNEFKLQSINSFNNVQIIKGKYRNKTFSNFSIYEQFIQLSNHDKVVIEYCLFYEL